MRAAEPLVPCLWQEPMDVARLRDTPFNCLVIDPAAKPPAEAVLDQARRAGLKVIPISAAPAEVLPGCGWPRVDTGGKDGASSGPTGLPWIESNGWRIRLARAKSPRQNIWVRYGRLPEKTALPLTREAYALAVADAAAHGGNWIVELDEQLRRGLASEDSRSLRTWRELVSTVEFFLRRKEWNALPPQAVLGVVSDFAGDNEFVATELLNLLARRQVGYRIIPVDKASPAETRGLHALLCAMQTPLAAGRLQLFVSFARAGGLSILPAAATAALPAGTAEADSHAGFTVRGVGQGRIAAAKQSWDDPYLAARDVHFLVSRRHDRVHLFNASSVNSYATSAEDGARAVVHLLNYSMRPPGSPVTLAVRKRYRQARLWTAGADGADGLRMTAEADWLEMPLPAFSVYAAVELLA